MMNLSDLKTKMPTVSGSYIKRHPELADMLKHLRPGSCISMNNGAHYLMCEALYEPLDYRPCLRCSLQHQSESFCLRHRLCCAHARPDGTSVRFILLTPES